MRELTMKLRSSLKKNDPSLYARLTVVEAKAKELLEYSQGDIHLYYTPHGLSHIIAVEACYDWLLSDQDIESFNQAEIFCLLCATFFHDALMIPKCLGTGKQARETHTHEAKEFLIKYHEHIGLSIHEANIIGEIIRGHGVSDLSTIHEYVALGHDTIGLRKLTACLSMADICHADASRAPEIVFQFLELDEESAYHWRRHFQISGITRKDDEILMSAMVFSDEGKHAIHEYKKSVEKQLEIVNPYFRSILSPISSVKLQLEHLDSPLDRDFRFQANIPAILDMLITGIYGRIDVFIRELVQNSLDACYLQQAKSFRRSESYSPKILVTLYYDDKGLSAVRIDDNGIGMDIYDIQDTFLWIGNTVSNKESVRQLLDSTTKKNLIASFGIGILSCIKVAEEILIRTYKEKSSPLEFSIKGISDTISPIPSSDNSIGSTVIVKLKDNVLSYDNVESAIYQYCRMVEQVRLSVLDLEYDDKTESYGRRKIFQIALTEGEEIKSENYSSEFCICEIREEDFRGWFWIDDLYIDTIKTGKGRIEILNDGIFVYETSADKWLPGYLSFFSGVINFAAKSIDLPVSRDRVQENEKFSRRKQELHLRSTLLIHKLAELTNRPSNVERRFGVCCLSFALSKISNKWEERFIRNIDDYGAAMYNERRRIPLREIRDDKPNEVYVEYEHEYVDEVARLDRQVLYRSKDDIVKLQAAMLVQEGKWVIHCEIFKEFDKSVSEVALVTKYFEKHGIDVIDLRIDRPLEGRLRSKPVSGIIRKQIGSSVKFVEITETPNQRAWHIGKEVWINTANPSMRRIYSRLQSGDLSKDERFLVLVMIQILSLNIEEAVNHIIRKIFEK